MLLLEETCISILKCYTNEVFGALAVKIFVTKKFSRRFYAKRKLYCTRLNNLSRPFYQDTHFLQTSIKNCLIIINFKKAKQFDLANEL